MFRVFNTLATTLVVVLAAVGLVACGGGSGGGSGGGGGGGGFLLLVGAPLFGQFGSVSGAPVPFNVATPSNQSQVGPTDFAAPVAGEMNFLQFNFSTTVQAASVLSGGIVIQDQNGLPVAFFLDDTGAIDASNTFPDVGIAPATLRLYFGTAGAPTAAPTGQFVLNLVTSRLLSGAGLPFCLIQSSGQCINDVEVSYSFTVGGDAMPIAPAANPSIPLVNSIIPIDQELRFFFSENVDFQSIVGATGAPPNTAVNVTQLDQFMSVPFPVNNLNPTTGATSAFENVIVTYTPPPPAVLPPNFSFALYLPDPFHNPRELRMRFVDGTMLNATDTVSAPQNYGIDGRVYASAGQPVPRSAFSNLALNLPSKLPLPGSDMTGPATLTVQFLSPMNMAATDSSTNLDGIFGVTDRARNALAADFTVNFTMQQGPQIANNSVPPDQFVVANATTLTAVSTGQITVGSVPSSLITGQLNPLTPPIDDPDILGQILDVGYSPIFLNPGNSFFNPPRNLAVLGTGDPAIPFPPGGNPTSDLCALTGLCGLPTPSQPLGTRIYVIDGTHNEVRFFDSTTFLPLGALTGIPSPRGLCTFWGGAATGDMYISNFDENTITRVGLNSLTPSTFHQVTATIAVGTNPTAVSVELANEDVFCINSGDNSVSKVDVASAREDAQFPIGLGGRDIWTVPRMNVPGGTGAYQAYISNFVDSTITIYESDTIVITEQNGPFGKIIETRGGFSGPSFGTTNYQTVPNGGLLSPGALVANETGTDIEQFAMVNWTLGPVPGFMGPPSSRTFATVQRYSAPLAGSPSDVLVENMSQLDLANLAIGAPQAVVASYPAAGEIAVFNFNTAAFLGSTSVPGNRLYAMFDQ